MPCSRRLSVLRTAFTSRCMLFTTIWVSMSSTVSSSIISPTVVASLSPWPLLLRASWIEVGVLATYDRDLSRPQVTRLPGWLRRHCYWLISIHQLRSICQRGRIVMAHYGCHAGWIHAGPSNGSLRFLRHLFYNSQHLGCLSQSAINSDSYKDLSESRFWWKLQGITQRIARRWKLISKEALRLSERIGCRIWFIHILSMTKSLV